MQFQFVIVPKYLNVATVSQDLFVVISNL